MQKISAMGSKQTFAAVCAEVRSADKAAVATIIFNAPLPTPIVVQPDIAAGLLLRNGRGRRRRNVGPSGGVAFYRNQSKG